MQLTIKLSTALILALSFSACDNTPLELPEQNSSSSSSIENSSSEITQSSSSSIAKNQEVVTGFEDKEEETPLEDTPLIKNDTPSVEIENNTTQTTQNENNETLVNIDKNESEVAYTTEINSTIPSLNPLHVSMQNDENKEITLEINGAFSYFIKNLPSWMTLTTNGHLTLNANKTLLGHKFFDIRIKTKNGYTTLTKGLDVSLFSNESEFTSRSTLLDTANLETIATMDKAIAHTSPRFFPKSSGENCLFLGYYPSYSNHNQIFIVDLESGETKNVDSTLFANDFIHLFKHVYLGNGRSFMAWPSVNGFMRYNIYDTNTYIFEADIIPLDTKLQNSQNAYDLAQGTDGKVYVFSSDDGSTSRSGVIEN